MVTLINDYLFHTLNILTFFEILRRYSPALESRVEQFLFRASLETVQVINPNFTYKRVHFLWVILY